MEAIDSVRRADTFEESFRRHNLTAPTGHAFLIEEEGISSPDGLLSVPPAAEVFAVAKTLGVDVVIETMPAIPTRKMAIPTR